MYTAKLRQAHFKGTIYGVLFNFQGQLEAIGKALQEKPYKEPPKRPVLYIKPRNTLNSHRKPVIIPEGETEIQVGAALGVVFEKNATNVSVHDAMDYVDGYTVVNDVSIPHDNFYRPNIKNKVRDGFCPVAPWVVKRTEVANPGQLRIRVYVNGELVQENNTKNLVRSVAQLVSDVSEFMTLVKGDMLLVGVPEEAPLAKAGDTVRIECDGVGVLENNIIDEKDAFTGGDL